MSSPNYTKDPRPPIDQRYLPRWEVANRVIYQTEKDPTFREAITKDLSCAGICLAISELLTLNQKIRMTIYLSDHRTVTVNGNVVWIQLSADQNVVGIQFYNAVQEDQDIILEHAFELNRQQLVKHWFQGWDGQIV